MRCALGQTIFCKALEDHIFRPFHLKEGFQESSEKMLDYFEDTPSQRVYRWQVFDCLEETDLDASDDAVGRATEVVHTVLYQLVEASKLHDFQIRTTEFFNKAMGMWINQIQRTSETAIVRSPTNDDENVNICKNYGERAATSSGSYKGEIIKPLFPRLILGNDMIHGGTALWSDQTVVMAAKHKTPSPTGSRSGTIGRGNNRRRSSATERPVMTDSRERKTHA